MNIEKGTLFYERSCCYGKISKQICSKDAQNHWNRRLKKCGEILRYNKQRVSKENKIKEKHMKQWENKKTNHDFEFIGRLIELLSVLKNKTDEKTTITQEQILEEMENNGYDCSERTLRDYLKKLMLKLNPEDED